MPAADPLGVLITRPSPGDAATAEAVARRGWRPIAAPSLVLAALPGAAPPRGAQALLLTSAAAVRALDRSLAPSDLPVFAVGAATAAAARAMGFAAVQAASGDAESLSALVAAQCDPARGPLWLAVGRGYATDLAAVLRGRGFRVARRVVYAARPARALPPAARDALAAGQVAAALFTSPRGAHSMVRLLRAAGLAQAARGIAAVAISQRVADALGGVAWKALHVATIPSEEALLDVLGQPAPASHDIGNTPDISAPRAAKPRMEQTPP
ncbi:uroporphyrinogen-III synthase [Humitalea sp. 24SJ18S-53]|uniref:uroporphyrinogen-III synthase n=1 Tax=Humitalea sp. 24SJ18S-53 TaxID=3422307 RepID=UPI003D67A4B0